MGKKVIFILVAVAMLLALVSLSGCSGGEVATLHGTVTDAVTGEPIEGATITTDPVTSTVTTDADGVYDFDVKPRGYDITASKEGYQTKTNVISGVENTINTSNFQMEPSD